MLLAPGWQLVLGAGILLWLAAVTVWLFKVSSHYSNLIEKGQGRNLKEILENLLKQSSQTDKKIAEVEEHLSQLAKNAEKHIQKVGLVKFNPFGDTGGNQSFALSLLNNKDTGVVILSLHGREGTRTYIKDVVEGKSRYDLSKEEKQAIQQAGKTN